MGCGHLRLNTLISTTGEQYVPSAICRNRYALARCLETVVVMCLQTRQTRQHFAQGSKWRTSQLHPVAAPRRRTERRGAEAQPEHWTKFLWNVNFVQRDV